MNNFGRALRNAVPYLPSLALAALCSLGVAALWGANIGAFYPILEVTIRGKSMQQWMDEEIQKAEQGVGQSTEAVSRKRERVEQWNPNETGLVQARRELTIAENQLLSEASKLEGYQRLKPWMDRFVPRDPFQTIAYIVIALLASTLIKHCFLIANEALVGRVALDISRNIRLQVFEKALGMDRAAYQSLGTSGFTSRIMHTTQMLSRGLMNTMGAGVREPLKVIACLIGAGLICWRLLVLSMLIAPLVSCMLFYVTRRLRDISRHQLSHAEDYHAVMLDSLGNINTVQSYCRESLEVDRFGDATMAMRNFGLKFIFYTSLSKPIIEVLGLGMLGTTIVGGAYLVLNQETHLFGIPICSEPLSVSALLVFFGMLIGLTDPLRKLSAVYSSIYAGCVAADSLYPMLDHSNVICTPEHPRRPKTPHRMLQLRNVAFGYREDQTILEDVTLDIPFGSTVAIVGHNGSGKSTLIHLLGRFYDPTSGSLRCDDVDFRDMSVEDVRKRIALVTQHTELFDNTVAYNIGYGKPDATDDEIKWAARQALAHEFICNVLPDGYQTSVGQNGSRLSGGQRQRIAVARALLCNPEVLILDEATSQIDMHSEALIRESLAAHRGERTMIIITHGDKLLELADQVFELVDGRLVKGPVTVQDAA